MCDVFYQNTITRKSFITSLLKIAVKPIVLDTKLDEWIYGSNFTEQIKEARTMQKVCAGIKPIAKVLKPVIQGSRNQENVKNPPVKYKQLKYVRHKKNSSGKFFRSIREN